MSGRYVPILDDDYMRLREAQRRAEYQFERMRYMDEMYLAAFRGDSRRDKKARQRPTSLEAAKQRFVDGKLSLEEYEAEVDKLLEEAEADVG